MKFGTGLRVVIVNGRPGVGKTLFEVLCGDILGYAYCNKRSTVDKVKEIAEKIGWNGQKDDKARKFLSDLKNLCTEYNDMPFYDVIKYLNGWESDLAYYGVGSQLHVLFIDDREPEHIDRLKKELNGITLLIRRPGDENIETSNHSDAEVFNYDYDYVIMNDGSIDDLKDEAQRFINSIFS